MLIAGLVLIGLLILMGLLWWAVRLARASDPDWESARERMVKTQIEARGVKDARVLEAMRTVPRHLFVPPAYRRRAYEDGPLPIGSGQTISQPFMVASMTELLEPEPTDRVLEIGTGSGYQAAILSRLVSLVYSIEILPELAESARKTLEAGGYTNVVVITGDGYVGLAEHAPFDGVIVTAAPETVPRPLIDQLGEGARLVIPVGKEQQRLQVLERGPEGVVRTYLFPVRFVPLVRGEKGED